MVPIQRHARRSLLVGAPGGLPGMVCGRLGRPLKRNRFTAVNLFPFIIAPMKLTREEVEHIAQLARLELTEEEKDRFREQLSDILAYAERLQALDTSHIPPTAS